MLLSDVDTACVGCTSHGRTIRMLRAFMRFLLDEGGCAPDFVSRCCQFSCIRSTCKNNIEKVANDSLIVDSLVKFGDFYDALQSHSRPFLGHGSRSQLGVGFNEADDAVEVSSVDPKRSLGVIPQQAVSRNPLT